MKQSFPIPLGATVVDIETLPTFNSVTPPPPANIPPVVNAGSNQTIKLPVNTVVLAGVASDPDGSIVSSTWSKKSGPSTGVITNPSNVNTTATALVPGTYVFTLSATDDKGAETRKDTTITVQAADVITPPPPPGNYGTLLYSTGFDKLSDIINGHGQEGAGGLSTSVFKTGPGSFYSKTAPKSSGNRSEVQFDSNDTAKEGVIEYDVLYRKPFQNNGHSFQFHPHTQGASANVGLWHTNGKFDVCRKLPGVSDHQNGPMTVPIDKWLYMRWHYKMSTQNDGYVQLYIDNNLYYDKKNIVTSDGSGEYLKIGQNEFGGGGTFEAYYDNLRLWKK